MDEVNTMLGSNGPALAEPAWALLVRARVHDSIDATERLLGAELVSRIEALAALLVSRLSGGGKAILFGNGGSAADATHLAAELVGRFIIDRRPLPALSLTDNPSSISAIANDYAYEDVFARQIRAFGHPGDVAIGLSTSGRSRNVVAGLAAAREAGLSTAAITGQDGGLCAAAAEICVRMPSTDTARVQECTMLVGHILCELVERALFR